MNIRKETSPGRLVLSIEGRLDTVSAPQLESELSLDGVTDLTLDLSGLEYTSSAGLRILLMTQKTMNKQGKMVVRGVRPTVKEIFDLTGFSDIFTFA